MALRYCVGLHPLAGEVIGRESDGSVCQVIRGVPFAATGRSYGDHRSHVGAVIGREWAARCIRLTAASPSRPLAAPTGITAPEVGWGPIGCLRVNIAALFILYVGCP